MESIYEEYADALITCERRAEPQTQADTEYEMVFEDCGPTVSQEEDPPNDQHQQSLEKETEAVEIDPVGEDGAMNDMSSPPPTQQSEPIQNSAASQRPVYNCAICGKMYLYFTAFMKHLELHEKTVRRRLPNYTPLRCEQCQKDFDSVKLWMIHVDLHKQREYWCLSCTKGFKNEWLLDQHLQGHSQRNHQCDLCPMRFTTFSQLVNHYTTHAGAQPYACTLCGQVFCDPNTIIAHQQSHLKEYFKSRKIPLVLKKSMLIRKIGVFQKETRDLPAVKMEPDEETDVKETPKETEVQTPCCSAGAGDHGNCEDCGEPLHHLAASDPHHGFNSDTAEPLDLVKSKTRETSVTGEHKYWEWECFECDMGFDDVENLHLHYVKHATGELPVLQADAEV